MRTKKQVVNEMVDDIISKMQEINPNISPQILKHPKETQTVALLASVLMKEIADLRYEVDMLKESKFNGKGSKKSRLDSVD